MLACVFGRAAADDDPRGAVHDIRVWFGELEGGPGDAPLSLQVSGGGRVLFTTAPRPVADARWRHSIRVHTARGQPLVFRVLSDADEAPKGDAPPGEVPRLPDRDDLQRIRTQDHVLAEAFDDLIGDLELPEARQAVRRDLPAASRPVVEATPSKDGWVGRVLCRAELSWPPVDGEHRVACGAMALTVRTRRLPAKAR